MKYRKAETPHFSHLVHKITINSFIQSLVGRWTFWFSVILFGHFCVFLFVSLPLLQSLCCVCCLRAPWRYGPVFGHVQPLAPARWRRAAACCATAPAWLSCPKSFPARPPPSTWRRTDWSSCQREPSVPCLPSGLSLWPTTTSPSSRPEPSRSASVPSNTIWPASSLVARWEINLPSLWIKFSGWVWMPVEF